MEIREVQERGTQIHSRESLRPIGSRGRLARAEAEATVAQRGLPAGHAIPVTPPSLRSISFARKTRPWAVGIIGSLALISSIDGSTLAHTGHKRSRDAPTELRSKSNETRQGITERTSALARDSSGCTLGNSLILYTSPHTFAAQLRTYASLSTLRSSRRVGRAQSRRVVSTPYSGGRTGCKL